MSQAHELLDESTGQLYEEFPVNFTVDGYGARVFVGLCPQMQFGNQLESGGFTIDADGVLGVRFSEFDAVGLKPFAGMRLRIRGVESVVVRLSNNDHLWELKLEASQTKAS